MPELPTGTVTLLSTDIEGSTRLLQRLGDDYARVLGEHQALLRAAFAAHGGAEVDTQGDAFFVAFPTAAQALAAAVAATRALAAHVWPVGGEVRVRMGLHTGTPQLVGDHYVGLDVHRAARIAAAGHGGQILLSATTRDLAEHALPAGATLRDLGLYRLRDLQQPERLYQLVQSDLLADFPALRTLDKRHHNLPVQPTPLLGRTEALAALDAWFRAGNGARLLTLTGPGGIGKTRLAVQVAAEVADAFADGVWFVRLSRLADPGLVVPTIAQALDLKEQGSEPISQTLRAHLAGKHLLLVLDNFEQVAGAAGEVAALLAGSPGLRVLVTSRTRLHLRGEREYPLAPLPLPEPGRMTPERLSQYAAVALFVERAREARPDFAVTASNAPAIAEICTRLDGLPLAIELAATRVHVLPPEALLARLSAQLKLLTGGARDLEERQQTMRNTLVWSEDLLTRAERVLFCRLAVFVGGCTLEAAEAICAAPEGAAPLELDVLEGLSVLVDQSLVQEREEGGEARFGLLHVIREYALERLEVSGELDALRSAHAAYFLALVEQTELQLDGSEAPLGLARLDREHDNLRAALGWARERGDAETGLRLAAAVVRFWVGRAHLREGRAWVEGMLALAHASETAAVAAGDGAAGGTAEQVGEGADRAAHAARSPAGEARGDGAVSSRVWARALHASGVLAVFAGEYTAAENRLEEALPLARAAGDMETEESALSFLAHTAQHQGDLERAAARIGESLALARQIGDPGGIASALTDLGAVAYDLGDLERAATFAQEALAIFRQTGSRIGMAICLANLGQVARRRGEIARALALGRDAMVLFRELGDPRRCTEGLEVTAGMAGAGGQGARAARLLGAAAAQRTALGAPQPDNERADVEQAVAAARAALGEEAWAAAFAAGQTLSLEAAIAEVLREDDGDAPA